MLKILQGSILVFACTTGLATAALKVDRAVETAQALAPEVTQKQLQVPPGFEVRLFAAEPLVVNPVAMTWDERGRLWVVESYEAAATSQHDGEKRDCVKILEDTDADGLADKATVFAKGYAGLSGLALGIGGVYLGEGTKVYFIEDTNGDDQADKQTILLSRSTPGDARYVLNGFAWGPDGWLYMTRSGTMPASTGNVSRPGATVDGALMRFHPITKKFEAFADGTSNPSGVDWNERGDAFVVSCGLEHLFHMAPGGLYTRPGGIRDNLYGYAAELPGAGLPAVVDWAHPGTTRSGICIYQGDQYPPEWRGLVFLGNVEQSALNCDRLSPIGSTYKAEKESALLGPAGQALLAKSGETLPRGDDRRFVGPGNFLVSRDPWFRPTSVQTGPDGVLWVADRSDQQLSDGRINSQTAATDRQHGRIWRIVWVGGQPGKVVASRPQKDMHLGKLKTEELAGLLEHPNSWQRREAQRLLSVRHDLREGKGMHASSSIHKVAESEKEVRFRLAALWALHGANEIEDDFLEKLKKDKEPAIRAWTARITGERGFPFGAAMTRLANQAKDTNASVRLAVAAAARQFVSGSLTVNTPPAVPMREVITGGVLSDLLKSPIEEADPVLPFVFWMALEPVIAFDASVIDYYENAKDADSLKWPMNFYVISRIMRRICDLDDSEAAGRAKHLNTAFRVIGGIASETRLADAALDGLILGLKNKPASLTVPLEPILAKLRANPALAEKTQCLARLLGSQ